MISLPPRFCPPCFGRSPHRPRRSVSLRRAFSRRTPAARLAAHFASSCATPFAGACFSVACVSISVADRASAAEPDVHRPNVVLMMADDMGVGDTSAYHDLTRNSDRTQIDTPSMARLARLGVRFSDAHSSSTRCTNTRYGLLTGRYPWRSRMKHWVLFGAQGDPMIEAARPTLATLFGAAGYRTAMVGKWHVGLRYRRSDGSPAAGFEDADLTKPLFDGPLVHGFDFAEFTSRSHGTSGTRPMTERNRPDQTVGPGHIDGRRILSATGDGRRLADDGPDAYVLDRLGGRHSDNAVGFMQSHLGSAETLDRPFFLYYASNSNHTPYTPDDEIGGVAVAGAGRNVAGEPLGKRADFVFENDVALGRLMRFLETHDDPRHAGQKLIENTVVIFTSDNGAEIQKASATGPFRSNKGSAYEGGHRLAAAATGRPRVTFDWRADANRVDKDLHHVGLAEAHARQPASRATATARLGDGETLTLSLGGIPATGESDPSLTINPRGLGLTGGRFDQVESGEAIEITFDRDVLVESAAIVAGNDNCGGSCRIADRAPLQIYCIDADNDQRDQSGVMSDLGVVRADEVIRFDSAPRLGVEPPGQWRWGAITVRPIESDAQ